MPIRRTLKNVVKNYSEAQIKVREATSNDAWGPSTTLMSEIADLTYNVVAYAEIMPILWRRLEDTGRNWRHVYKSLVLLDYLVRNGSERVARECRERAWAIQAIADSFEFAEGAESSGQDRGAGVRERARALTALLRDDDRLRNERAKALKARERFAQNSSSVSGSTLSGSSAAKYNLRSISPLHSGSMFSESAHAGGYSEFGSPSLSSLEATQFGLEGGASTALESELEALRPTSAGEEELQLQLALAMSKEEHEEELRRLKGDEAKLQMALDESRKQAPGTSPSPIHAGGSARPPSENADLLASLKDSSEVSSHWTLPSAGAGASLSEHRFKSPPASTMPDPWLSNNPPILPPPPSKVSQQQQQQQQQQQLSSLTAAEAAAVSTDPWLSTSPEINLGAWGAQPPAMTSSLTAAATNSARSSPWESPSHGFGNNTAVSAVVFDDEFDVIGARSRSPGLTGAPGLPPAVPPRRPLTGGEVAAGGDPWDFSFINQSLNQDDLMRSSVQSTAGFQPPSLSSVAVQPPATSRKSAQDFLGDNANLVNLDNLFSLPVSGPSNPFGVSTSRSSSPAVVAATTNPFGAPPPIPVRQFQTGPAVAPSSVMSPFVLSTSPASGLTTATGSSVFISQDVPPAAAAAQFSVGSAASAAAYPQAYNPFL